MVKLIRDLSPIIKENLEHLQLEAAKIPSVLEAGIRSWNPNTVAAYAELNRLIERIRERRHWIGEELVARILRNPLPPENRHGIVDNPSLQIEPALNWVNGVIANIDHELDLVDRKWILLISAVSTIVAAIAALAALASALFEAITLFQK